jgi:hypothetical protein
MSTPQVQSPLPGGPREVPVADQLHPERGRRPRPGTSPPGTCRPRGARGVAGAGPRSRRGRAAPSPRPAPPPGTARGTAAPRPRVLGSVQPMAVVCRRSGSNSIGRQRCSQPPCLSTTPDRSFSCSRCMTPMRIDDRRSFTRLAMASRSSGRDLVAAGLRQHFLGVVRVVPDQRVGPVAGDPRAETHRLPRPAGRVAEQALGVLVGRERPLGAERPPIPVRLDEVAAVHAVAEGDRGLLLRKMPRHEGHRSHAHAGVMTDTIRDLAVPGGMLISRFWNGVGAAGSACLRAQPSRAAWTWSATASMCQFHASGVDGSRTCQPCRMNSARLRRARSASTWRLRLASASLDKPGQQGAEGVEFMG